MWRPGAPLYPLAGQDDPAAAAGSRGLTRSVLTALRLPREVNVDELFLFTLDDLESRLELGRNEYDALMGAWLLRKLLLNGRRSLVSAVADPRGYDARIRTKDDRPGPTIQLWGPEGAMVPDGTAATVDLTPQDFLKWPAVVMLDASSQPITLTVSDVIFYLANVAGAVPDVRLQFA
jgi:hypothetical protein